MRASVTSVSLSIVLLALFGTHVFGQGKIEQALIARQHSYFDAVIKKKYDFLESIIDKDYIATYSLGIFDKAREVKDLKEFPLVEYAMSETKTAFPNKKTGIISFKLHVKVTVEGKDYFEDDFLNCVWTKHGKEWLLSSQAAVKVPAK